MHIGQITGGCAARVDHHDFHRGARGLGCGETLVQNRMAPREVAARQHHQIGQFQIVIGAGHGIGAKCPPLPCHGRGHAKTRIRVDVGGPDKAFHQLVGDIVVLGQQLTRDIKGHGLGPVLGHSFSEPVSDQIQRRVPVRVLPKHTGGQQPVVQRQRLAQCKTLGTQPPVVRGMVRIAPHRQTTRTVRPGQDTAAHPAIGTGGAYFRHLQRAVHHATCPRRRRVVSSMIRPFSTRTA